MGLPCATSLFPLRILMRSLTRTFLLSTAFAVFAVANASATLFIVDNHAPAGGDGTIEHPFRTIAAASEVSHESDVIYVTPSSTPYAETVILKFGQKLVGASDDPVIGSMGVDLPKSSDMATIQGTVNLGGDNVVAALTIVADRTNGVSAAGSSDKILIRNVHFRTSNSGFGLYLADHGGDVSVIGGGLEATQNGGGIAVVGGTGNVFFDQFPMSGSFATVVRASDHAFGAILFREGCDIRVDDALYDAIVLENLGTRAPIAFNAGLSVRSGRRRGIVASHVQRLNVGGDATIATTNAAALDISDSAGDAVFHSVSAEGTTPYAIRITRFRGHAAIQGGTVRGATSHAIDIDDATGVEVTGVIVDGGGGIVATKPHDVTFNSIDVRNATGVMVSDVDGAIHFERCTFTTPVTIDQRVGTGSVMLDRCHFDKQPVRLLATGATKVNVEINGADASDSAMSMSAVSTAQIAIAVHGGRFTRSPIDAKSDGTSSVCADISGARFSPSEKAIQLSAAEGWKLAIVGARNADASSMRTTIAQANNGASVSIDAPSASLSAATKCE